MKGHFGVLSFMYPSAITRILHRNIEP